MEGYKYAKTGLKDNLVPQIDRKTASAMSNSQVKDPGAEGNNDNSGSVSVSMEEEGVIPRAIRELFNQVEAKRTQMAGKSKISVKVQYIQLYNEKVFDLLNSNSQKAFAKKRTTNGLKIKTNALTDDVTIENVYIFECTGIEDAFKYFWKGLKNKVMSSHNMNQSSSRSHCILTFIVQQQDLTQAHSSANIISKL